MRIKDEAIVAAVELSQRYITSRFLPDKAIDLIDEAASKLRLEMNSVPEEIDVLDRRVRQLEIEREAIRRENDKERVEQLTHEIEELGAKRAELRAKWEGERDVLKKIQENKDRIEHLKIEAQQAERQAITAVWPRFVTARFRRPRSRSRLFRTNSVRLRPAGR